MRISIYIIYIYSHLCYLYLLPSTSICILHKSKNMIIPNVSWNFQWCTHGPMRNGMSVFDQSYCTAGSLNRNNLFCIKTDTALILADKIFGPVFNQWLCNGNVRRCYICNAFSLWLIPSLIARLMGPTWGPFGADRWAPCWPHEFRYLGYSSVDRKRAPTIC